MPPPLLNVSNYERWILCLEPAPDRLSICPDLEVQEAGGDAAIAIDRDIAELVPQSVKTTQGTKHPAV